MAMKYFRDEDGSVWAFNEDGSQDDSITQTMVEMSEADIELHLNPPPDPQQVAESENEWRTEQMPIALNNVTAIEFGEEGIPGTAQEWKKFWLALRKWTDTNPDFPDSSKRPVAPS
jgi:hypothetical protein